MEVVAKVTAHKMQTTVNAEVQILLTTLID